VLYATLNSLLPPATCVAKYLVTAVALPLAAIYTGVSLPPTAEVLPTCTAYYSPA